MKTQSIFNNSGNRILSNALLFSAAIALSAGAQAAVPWTTVGSAGTVDEADMAAVSLSGATASVSSNVALPRTVVIRYKVTTTSGLEQDLGPLGAQSGGVSMKTVLRDTGLGANVKLRLLEFDNVLKIGRTIVFHDSDVFPGSFNFQHRENTSCSRVQPFKFDFERKTYFVEAEIQKGTAEALPSLVSVDLDTGLCPNIE